MFRRLVDLLPGRSKLDAAPAVPATDHAADRDWEAASQQRSRDRDTANPEHAAAQQAHDLTTGVENAS